VTQPDIHENETNVLVQQQNIPLAVGRATLKKGLRTN